MCDKGFKELVDDSYTLKQTKERKLVEETLFEFTSQCAPFSESETLAFPETEKSLKSLFLLKSFSASELRSAQPPMPEGPVKHPGEECTHNIVLFQNLLRDGRNKTGYKVDWAKVRRALNGTPEYFWERQCKL